MDLAIRQSQAEIAELRWHRKVALFEWLKNTFQRVRANPAPAIAELDLELGGYHYRRPQLDDPAWRCELDGVTQKVPKYLLKSTGVPLQMIAGSFELHLEINLLRVNGCLTELADRSDEIGRRQSLVGERFPRG
jgi:hypothetical protein